MPNIRAYNGVDVRGVDDPIVRTALLVMDLFLRDLTKNPNLTTEIPEAGVGGAPTGASYVTVVAESGLSAERRLVASNALSLTDGGANTTISIGATLVAPAFAFGTAAAAGVANSLVRSDATIAIFDATAPADLASAAATGDAAVAARRNHVHKFPTTLKAATSGGELTLTDDTGFDLEGGVGTGALSLRPETTLVLWPGVGSVAFNVNGDFDNNNILIQSAWAGGALASETVACWDARHIASTGVWTTATILGYDTSAFNLTGSAGSDANNKAYCTRLSGPNISGTNAGWTEVATLYMDGPPKPFVGSPTCTLSGTILATCPTLGVTDQIGLYLRQRTAGATATNRYGIKIDTQNSGTNRWAIYAGDRVEIQAPSAQATTALLLRQLSTGATAGAHINFDDKAGNPGSPNVGDLWRNGTALNYRKDGSTTIDLAGLVSGDSVSVNGTAATDADFDDATPTAPSGYMNVRWQKDTGTPNNISGYFGKDVNGNAMLTFAPVASANRNVEFTQGVSGGGSSPRLSAVGTGTDIDIEVLAKGGGSVVVSPLLMVPGAPTATPSSTYHNLYGKAYGNVGRPYIKDNTGIEFPLLVQRSRLTADHGTTSSSYGDVNDIAFALESGKTYSFVFNILFTTDASTTGGHFSLNGPSTSELEFVVSNRTTTALAESLATAYDTGPAPTSGPGSLGAICTITGSLTTSVAGTLKVRFKTEVATSTTTTAKRGSYGVLYEH